MRSVGPEGSIQIENQHRALSYRPEFKEWSKAHPGVMSKVVRMIEEIVQKLPEGNGSGEMQEEEVHVVHKKQPYSDVFEVTVGQDKFFVKRDATRLENRSRVFSVGGQGEYTDSVIAKIGLGEDPDIEIIDFQLGYTSHDEKKPVGYFVSRWEDLRTVDSYLNDAKFPEEEKRKLVEKGKKAVRLFHVYRDIRPENMFYDPITKKIKMFDLNINPFLEGD